MHTKFLSKNLKGRDNFGDLGVDVRMDLKQMEYEGNETSVSIKGR
jgi:hypothetical protein